jgi:phosphopantetheinyl transferase
MVFYQAWTRQEAQLKCLGVGLSGPHDAPQMAIENLEIAPDYAAAVAVIGGDLGPVLCRSLFAG